MTVSSKRTGFGVLLLLILSFLTAHASATLITSFTNCLPEDVQQSPTHLQFHPLAVDAIFNVGIFPYKLNITVYGNVTGKSSENPSGTKRWLSALTGRSIGEEGWEPVSGQYDEDGVRNARRHGTGFMESVEDPAGKHEIFVEGVQRELDHRIHKRSDIQYETGGSILRQDPAWQNDKQTTLQSQVDVLTFQLVTGLDAFCNSANCPMEPVTNLRFVVIVNDPSYPRSLPSFMVSTELNDTYALTSIISTFIIVSGDAAATQIGCVKVEVTPALGPAVSNALQWTPVGILIFVGLATISAAIFNPWNGTKDVFRWSSNYGMDDDMLRLVTPGFGDCLQYLQFAVLTGSLTLAYPGFFQPYLSKVAWSVLLFNTNLSSSVSASSLVDNLYIVDSQFGLERMAKYVGIANTKDIWPVTMIYMAGILLTVIFFIQVGFLVRWGFMKVKSIAEEDLRAKNRPFTFGNILRLFFNYLLTPFVAFTTFQFVIHNRTPDSYTGLSATFFTVYIALTVYLMRLIIIHKPRPALCDDLPTLLLYGPLYNTYRLEAISLYCPAQIIINILRAVAFGGVQQSGIAQLTLLVVCEVLQILVINACRPYSAKTSMNLYQTFFSAVRLLTVVFMMAFIPQLKIADSAKGWIAYAILLCHGIVMVFGFFLNALQTVAEIVARLMGAGNDGGTAARGGLAQVFGKRQLSRRSNRHETAYRPAHRHTDSSGAPSLMNGPDGDRKSNYAGNSRPGITTGAHSYKRHGDNNVGIPADNAALVGLLGPDSPAAINHGHKHTNSSSTAFTPTSPVTASYPSGSGAIVGLGVLAAGPDAGPFFRPPRTRTNTIGVNDSQNAPSRGSWATGDWTVPRYDSMGNPITPTDSAPPRALFGHVHSSSQGSLPGSRGIISEDWDTPTALNTNNPNSGAATPPAFGPLHGPGSMRHQTTESTLGSGRGHTDYAVREMDFYYGVRGPALSSAAPSRKLGTGPADPTSPMAVAKGWLLNRFARRKEKAKGFEVVRSARAPEMLREMQEAAEKARKDQEGKVSEEEIGVAVTRDRDDNSDSDDEEDGSGQKRVGDHQVKTTTDSEDESDSDNDDDNYGEGPSGASGSGRAKHLKPPPVSTGADIALTRGFSKGSQQGIGGAPKVPRKSSKRRSTNQLFLGSVTDTSVPFGAQRQSPELAGRISPIPMRSHVLYDPPLQSHTHLHQPQEQNKNSSTRLPFQTPSMHSHSSSRNERNLAVDGTNSSPTNSRNSSNASSILPPVPGLYSTRGGDSGSVTGSTGGQGRPASVGTVNRHRMEDSLTEVTDQRALVAGLGSTAELVERSNSLASVERESVAERLPETQPREAGGRRRYSFE
ncbi:hypothetical protein EV426DRAFT_537619 [Tirmania nivea]|nr:hypothetical protein EV426DRAFT_537619 [Tirmania nivea]